MTLMSKLYHLAINVKWGDISTHEFKSKAKKIIKESMPKIEENGYVSEYYSGYNKYRTEMLKVLDEN